MPPSPALPDLLRRLSQGELSVDETLRQISASGISPGSVTATADPNPPNSGGGFAADPGFAARQEIEGATVDLGRRSRCGFSEVIYGEGKPAELITEIVRAQLEAGQTSLVTRIDPTAATQVRRCFPFPHSHHHPLSHTLRVAGNPIGGPQPLPDDELAKTVHVAVVTAGSTDLPVAEEAIETLAWMEVPFQRFDDIGVAGPHRLLHAVPRLRHASAVVVIAGMEGALAAAIAGHLAVPVFAVPTSVGYGANFGGLTPLLGMLNACAANVAVVNIDAGFKGAYLAGVVAGQLQRRLDQRDA